jgi:hypothetical protein
MWYSLTRTKISSNSNRDRDYRSAQPNLDRFNETTLSIRLTRKSIVTLEAHHDHVGRTSSSASFLDHTIKEEWVIVARALSGSCVLPLSGHQPN